MMSSNARNLVLACAFFLSVFASGILVAPAVNAATQNSASAKQRVTSSPLTKINKNVFLATTTQQSVNYATKQFTPEDTKLAYGGAIGLVGLGSLLYILSFAPAAKRNKSTVIKRAYRYNAVSEKAAE